MNQNALSLLKIFHLTTYKGAICTEIKVICAHAVVLLD